MGNSKIKGNSTELGCMLAFIKKGWVVSIPFGEDSRYDMVVDRGSDIIKVQCKYAKYYNNSTLKLTTMHNNKKYIEGEIDYFATIYKDKCYLIPYENKKAITLRLVPPKNNQKKSIRFAHDYFIGSII